MQELIQNILYVYVTWNKWIKYPLKLMIESLKLQLAYKMCTALITESKMTTCIQKMCTAIIIESKMTPCEMIK